MNSLLQDLRYGARMLRKNPGFTITAVLTLAMGLGVSTSIFTLFYSAVLRPLPVKDPERVVNVYQTTAGQLVRRIEGSPLFVSYPEYVDYRDQTRAFAGLAAYAETKLALSGGEAESIPGLLVSDNYFSVLGAEAAMGRTFAENECQMPGGCPLAVLSYGFWQRRFGADATIIGKTLLLNRRRFTVVGIAARDFRGTEMAAPDLWVPLMMQAQLKPDADYLPLRDCSWLKVVGRLKSEVSLAQAQAEMSVVAAQADQDYPGRKTAVEVTSGAYLNGPEVRSLGFKVVMLITVVVGLVLLIVCANMANLLLARAANRQREIGVRLAMGASRGRLIRQLLTESLLLALLGGAAGLLIAFWLPPILMSAIPEAGLDINLSPDLTVFSYTFFTSLVVGVVFGLAPALEATRLNLVAALKAEGSVLGQRLSGSRLNSFLVITQVAVSLVLLMGTGLLIRSLQRAQSVDLGFEPKHMLVCSLDLASEGQAGSSSAALVQQLSERLMALPGVESVSLAGTAPFSGASYGTITLEGRKAAGQEFAVNYNVVSPAYFHTLGIPIIHGRPFSEQEAHSGQPVAVVSAAMAKRFWPGDEPIGKRFKSGAAFYEIVGVARDISSIRPGVQDGPFLYLPATPDKLSGLLFLVRTATNPQTLVTAVKDTAQSLDKNVPVAVKPMTENLNRVLQPARSSALLLGALSLLAWMLAMAGVYGVVAYSVSRRTREIGIRMALGAQPGSVLLLVIRQGLRLILIGIGTGLLLSFAASQILSSALFGLSAFDPLTFVVVSLLVVAVALLACYIPARKATQIEPTAALRYE
jgi:macrolide transport system ATP-binding/permease protein